MSKLTSKQQRFAELVAMGSSATEAYRQSYNTQGNQHTQHCRAHELLKNSEVRATITAIREAAVALSVWTLADSIGTLAEIASNRDAPPTARVAAALGAAKILSETQQHAITGEVPAIRIVFEGPE